MCHHDSLEVDIFWTSVRWGPSLFHSTWIRGIISSLDPISLGPGNRQRMCDIAYRIPDSTIDLCQLKVTVLCCPYRTQLQADASGSA